MNRLANAYWAWFFGLSCLLFVVACALPAIEGQSFGETGSSIASHAGVLVLVFGWIGVLQGQFAWLANPLLLLTWILLLARRWTMAILVGILAFVAGSQTFAAPGSTYTTSLLSTMVVRGLQLGAYIWFASLFAAVVAGVVGILPTLRERCRG